VGRISTKIGNLGAIFGFWIFWVLGSGNSFQFPRTPFFGEQIFQNPREFHRTRKSQRVCTSADHNPTTSRCVVHTYSVVRKRRTRHDYIVLCHSRIQRSTQLPRVVSLALCGSFELLCCSYAESNISFQIIILNFSNGEYLHFWRVESKRSYLFEK
jgi:hypothetical protein